VAYDPEKLRQILLESSDDDESPRDVDKKPGETAAPEVKQDTQGHVEGPKKPVAEPTRPVVPSESKGVEPPIAAPASLDPMRKVTTPPASARIPEAGFASFTEDKKAEEEIPAHVGGDPTDSSASGVMDEIENMRMEAAAKLGTSIPDRGANALPSDARIPVKQDETPPQAAGESTVSSKEYRPYRQVKASSDVPPEEKPAQPDETGTAPDKPKIPSPRVELAQGPAGDFSPLREALKAGQATIGTSDDDEPEPEKPSGRKGKKKKLEVKAKPVKKRKTIAPPKPPSPLSYLTLIGGAISLTGATIALAIGQGGTPVICLGGLGILLVGGYGIVNRRWIRLSLTSRSARYSANVATVILSLAGILIFVNILAYRHHYRIDMSAAGVHSLAPQTLGVLEKINRAGEDVNVIAFTPPDSGFRDNIEGLIDLYTYETTHLKFSFADPDVQRELAESKGINRNPSILFELGERRAVVSDIDEPHFTSALLTVQQTHPRLVSFLAGHGESDPFSDEGANNGLSEYRKQLELEGYDVDVLRIPAENGIPSETSLLVIASPQRDLEQQEINEIDGYLEGGGSVIIFLEPGKDAGLGPVLQKYGLAMADGIVADDENNAYGEFLSPVATGNPEHLITSQFFEQELVFINAGGISYTTSGRSPDVTIEKLVSTWPSSWLETSGDIVFDDGTDVRGAQDLAVLATRNHGEGQWATEETQDVDSVPEETLETVEEESPETGVTSQLLLVTDGSFIQNANIDRVYNKDFAMNAVNFMTAQHDLLTIRPANRSEQPLELTNAQKNAVFIFSVLFMPLLVAGFGGLVWWRRR